MSIHLECPNCAAPLSAVEPVAVLHCDYCGADSPVPDHIKDDPLWDRKKQLRAVNHWYHVTRSELMVVDKHGNQVPPPRTSSKGPIVFVAMSAAGFIVSIPLLFLSALFWPLFFLIVFPFFGLPVSGLLYAYHDGMRTKQRHAQFQKLEQEYRRRIEALG